jgi:hypothetical protein
MAESPIAGGWLRNLPDPKYMGGTQRQDGRCNRFTRRSEAVAIL